MKKVPLPLVGLLQALGLIIYCSLVGLIFWKGSEWFGKMNNLLGPVMVLSLLVVSALICAIIAAGYPFYIFWEKKKTNEAIRIVLYTAGFLVLFLITVFTILGVYK